MTRLGSRKLDICPEVTNDRVYKISGRWSVGNLVAVKKFLAPQITVIKKTPDYICCMIDKALFHMRKDVSVVPTPLRKTHCTSILTNSQISRTRILILELA